MKKAISGLLLIMLVLSLVSGCYRAPAPAAAPTPAPPPTEKAPTPTEKASAPTEKAPAPAVFTISALNISPTEVDIGKSVTISVLVTNTGGLTASYEVTLKVANVVVATKDVTLAGGASQTITFTTAKDVAGTYTVNVSGLSGTFTVKTAPTSAPAPTPAPAPGGGTIHHVTIKNFAFTPQEITIKVGDTVTWTHQDSVPHTTTGNIWDSGHLGQGKTYSKTFDKAGTYDYICTIHPSMKGKVIVGNGGVSDGGYVY